MSLENERAEWEEESLSEPLPSTVKLLTENIAGVECVWVTFKAKPASSSKFVIYLHGGGLVAGSAVTHQQLAASLLIESNTSVLLVNYRLLPEHRYPAPLDDVLQVFQTLTTEQGYSPKQITLGGDSSGGGLAIAALVCLRNSGVDLPRNTFVISGAFDMTLSGDSISYNDSADKHLSKEALHQWQSDYLNFNLTSPLLSPLFADLSNLTPILLITGEKDPWVSDSERLMEKILQHEGNGYLHIWKSVGHVFVMDLKLDESKQALKEIAKFITAESFEECVV